MTASDSTGSLPEACQGRILGGDFSDDLQTRVRALVQRFQLFDEAGSPAIPYVAAWHAEGQSIWYEFVGRRLALLLGCDCDSTAERFRSSVVERRVFRAPVAGLGVREEILPSEELNRRRAGLREEVRRDGTLEAVYKVAAADAEPVWLKDQALVEYHESDALFLSIGCLTPVSHEMALEDDLKSAQEALRVSERKFREQAVRDNLTGLYNTRYLYRALQELIAGSRGDGSPFSLVFMDMDNFKAVVDAHGHLNASRTLQEVAGTIRETLAAPAFGVAYGGDEFVAVLPGFEKSAALELAERLRAAVAAARYLTGRGLCVRVQASLGVSTFPEDAEDLTDMLALADQAMFRVKKQGKNAVAAVGPEGT
jgi:diguanylate cyclase (GGDEF)-like protein